MRRCLTAAQRGMTLIELMVVMAIIAILIVVGAVSIAAISGADVDATGSILSGAMTYVSSRAVHDNKTYRMVIDMDQRRFWTESTNDDDPCSRFLPEEAEPPAEDADKKKEGEEEAAPADDGKGFSKDAIDLMHRAFEGGTNVTAVLTSHHTQAQTSGKVAIYFYPNGQAERALVWVGARGESPTGWVPEITVELHSLGRVTWHSDPVDEKDFDLQRLEEVQ